MQWMIDAKLIDRWCDEPSARSQFPRLVRRLIRATTDHLTRLDMPAGSSTDLGEWDGVVKSEDGSDMVPAGASGWELSVRADVGTKATDDYEKRSSNSLGLDQAATAFVFATARRWPGKAEWTRARQEEGTWKEVRALDADDLSRLLEEAPAVAAWFGSWVDQPVHELSTLQDEWERFAEITTPALPPELLHADRSEEVEKVIGFLDGDPDTLVIRAESELEAIAFVAAALKANEEYSEHWSARTAVVADPKALGMLKSSRKSLLVIYPGPIDDVQPLTLSGHYVIVPMARRPARSGFLALPKVSRESFKNVLIDVGVGEVEAEGWIRKTGRSLPVLRRQLTKASDRPEWAGPERARHFIPALLAGSWDSARGTDEEQGDKLALERLSGVAYETLADRLTVMTDHEEPPLRQVGSVWSLTAPMDAFMLMAPYLRMEDLERFKQVTLEVLSEADPSLDLPAEQRYAAAIYKKDFVYSNWLRTGLAESLLLLAVTDQQGTAEFHCRPSVTCERIAMELLNGADEVRWYSLSKLLPRLAEAAPEIFLDAVERALEQDEPPLLSLFESAESPLFSSERQSHLLWGLEVLAWSPEHLTQVAVLLMRLSAIDPGGRTGNRPSRSLHSLFQNWMRRTAATTDQRLEALEVLVQRDSERALRLLLSLLPGRRNWSMPTLRPRYRSWDGEVGSTVSTQEFRDLAEGIEALILDNLPSSPAPWEELIKEHSRFSHGGRRHLRETLLELSSRAKETPEGKKVWDALRDLVTRYRQHPDADWSLPTAEVETLADLQDSWAPDDWLTRSEWLFKWHVELPEPRDSKTHAEREEEIRRRRADSLSRMYQDGGLSTVAELARRVKDPELVGHTASYILMDRSDEVLREFSGSSEEPLQRLFFGYVRNRSLREDGEQWAAEVLDRRRDLGWTEPEVVEFFCALLPKTEIWKLLSGVEPSVQTAYWEQVNLNSCRDSPEQQLAVSKMLDVGRPAHAVAICTLNEESLPSDLLLRALEQLAAQGVEEGHRRPDALELEGIISTLQERDDVEVERLGQIEWIYWDLQLRRSSFLPRTLFRWLERDASFFIKIFTAQRLPEAPEGGTSEEVSDEEGLSDQQVQAKKSWWLLNEWAGLPGLSEQGNLDLAALRDWIAQARDLAEPVGPSEEVDFEIGRILSRSPVGKDNIWPCEEVRQLIEELETSSVESGVRSGRRNQRGVVMRALGEGGDQEKQLESHYRQMAKETAGRWPRTSKVLRKLADSYSGQAGYWDERAKLEDLYEH